MLEEVVCDRGRGKGKVLIDVGCGDGAIANNLASHFGTVYGIDMRNTVLGKSRFKFIRNDFCKMNTRELEGADTVLFSLSLHHMDIEKALETAKKLLRGNGTVIVSDIYSSRHKNFFSYFVSQIVFDSIMNAINISNLINKYGFRSYLTYIRRRIAFMFRDGGARHIKDDINEGRTRELSDWNKILERHLPQGDLLPVGLSGFLYIWKKEGHEIY